MARVLVADDSATVRLMLRNWLAEAGHDVLEAADGQQAIDLIQSTEGPLVVLLDYQMPKLTGFEVLQRALAAGRIPPAFGYVIVSGEENAFPAEFTDLLRRLAIQLLPKPFAQDALLMVTDYVAARTEAATVKAASPADSAS